MADRDVRILHDTERVWIIVILLAVLWLAPPLPGQVWIVLGATAILTALFLIPFGREWLRHLSGLTTVLTVLGGLAAAQVANVIVRATAGGWGELGVLFSQAIEEGWAVALGAGAVGLMFAVGAALWFIRLPERRIELPGASFELTARGLFIPLILCGVIALWARPADSHYLGVPVVGTAILLFLFHFYTFWSKKRRITRWLCLIAIALAAPGGLVSSVELMGDSMPFGAAPLAVAGLLRAVFWDLPGIILASDIPGVREFFAGGPLGEAFSEQALSILSDGRLLHGLSLFESAGVGLAPGVALVLPALVALRAVRGEPRSNPVGYAVWLLALSVITMPLWGSTTDIFLFRPLFLGKVAMVWLTQGLPLQVALSLGLFSSAPLASALSGQSATIGHPSLAPGGNQVPVELSESSFPGSRLKRFPYLLTSERVLLPPLCAILVVSGLIGGICVQAVNHAWGTFRGVLDPRPGETAQAPILEPLFTKKVSPKIRYFEGWDDMERLEKALLSGVPDVQARDRLTSETQRPEVQPYIEAVEHAAEADVCGWKVLTARKAISIPSFINLREAGRFMAARARVAMARNEWDAAWQDIRRLIRFGAVFGSEGTLVQRMIGVALRNIGVRTATLAIRSAPEDQLGPLLRQLRSLDGWVQRLSDQEALEEAEPLVRWPGRFVYPDLTLPGFMRAMTVDKACVAKFRLLHLACAARKYLAENGQLPEAAHDLRPLLGNLRIVDPFSGGDFKMEFTDKYVRFLTPRSLIPGWFDTIGTKYLPTITVYPDGEVAEQ